MDMVRVLGNSAERVKIPDLNDVIYYRQQKEYTDQEYEDSRDLKKEIGKGRITLLERCQSLKMQPQTMTEASTIKVVSPTISQEDVKKAVAEVLSGFKSGQAKVDTQEIKNAVSEALGRISVVQESKPVDPQEIKRLVAEVLAENKSDSGSVDMSAALLSMIPMIADAVRQEVARIQIVSSHSVPQKTPSMFMGSEFIPTVSTEGMTSNVKGEERTASGGDVLGSLDALKRLKK